MERTGPGKRARWIGAGAVLLLTAGALTASGQHDGNSARTAVGQRPAGAPRSASTDEADMQPGIAALQSGAARDSSVSGGAGGPDSVANAASGAGQSADPAMGPRIVKRAELRVEVKKDGFRAAFDRVTALASSHGGFVATSTSRTADESEDEQLAAGTLVIRVPAAAFDTVRAALAGLGDVAGETVSGEDVGGQLVDLDARIRSLQVEEDALRALMAKARTVGETIEVQQQLTRVRQQIEQLQGQRAHLADAAALATLHVDLFEPGVAAAEPGGPNRLAESFRTAVDGTLAVIGGTVVVIGYLLPLALLSLLGWALWRLATRRTRLAV